MKTISEHLYKNSFLLSIVRHEATKQKTTESLESKYDTPDRALCAILDFRKCKIGYLPFVALIMEYAENEQVFDETINFKMLSNVIEKHYKMKRLIEIKNIQMYLKNLKVDINKIIKKSN